MPKLDTRLSIINYLSEFRSRQSLTQQDLADAVGVTRGTIIALEKGNYNPSLELAFRLAQFFQVSIDQLFFIEEDKK